MDFQVPSPQGRYRVYEVCPRCKTRIVISDKRIVLLNKELECIACGHKWKLNINRGK